MYLSDSTSHLLTSSPDRILFNHKTDIMKSPTMTLTHTTSPQPRCQGHCHMDDLYRKGTQSSTAVMSFANTKALCGDLQKLLYIPEICDVKFLVGKSKTPVYGVKAILATRNRVFFDMILAKQRCTVHDNQQRNKQKKSLISKIKQRLIGKVPSRHLVLEVPDLEAVCFQKVIVYLQTGDISVEISNVFGVLAVADRYGLDDLRQACHRFALKSITVTTAFSLLRSAEVYPQCKWTKLILTDVLDFISPHAQEFLQRKEFISVSLESAVLVMSYPELRATDEQKWDAVYRWFTKKSAGKEIARSDGRLMKDAIQKLAVNIEVRNIPIKKLLREVKPLGVVSNDVIKELIAHWSSSKITLLEEDEISSNDRQTSMQYRRTCAPDQYEPMNDHLTNECDYEAIEELSSIHSTWRSPSGGGEFILNADSSMLI